MAHVHLGAAWGLVVGGLLTGVALGLFFHREDWMGGYGSWRRRMARLGHISFFGTAFLNLLAAVTPGVETRGVYGTLLLAGAVAMPTVCFLSAWRKPFRHAFFIPVLCLVIGSAGFAFGLWCGG